MSTTSSVNAGLASLLQNLSNIGSPILSSPKALAALQNAPPADIVQLSDEAIQLEGLNALFGAAEASGSSQAGSLLSSLLGGPDLSSNDASGNSDPANLLTELSIPGSPATEAALQNATPGDIVQLSSEATEQAGLTQLFGQAPSL
jgi:hypothetical protein